eukprot:jgi/Mesvir1/20319/Mv19909-RA.1
MADGGWGLRQPVNAFFPGPAGAVDCIVTAWSNWTTCTATCGGGTRNRTRRIQQPAAGYGGPCPLLFEEEDCNVEDCPQDCVLAPWGEWGACSVPCGGGGVRKRRRALLVAPKGGGSPCPSELEEEVGCYVEPCSWGDAVPSPDHMLIAVSLQGSGHIYNDTAGASLVHTLDWQVQVARFIAYLSRQAPAAAHTVYSGLDTRAGTPPVSGRFIAPIDPALAGLRYMDFMVWVRVAVATEEPKGWRSREPSAWLVADGSSNGGSSSSGAGIGAGGNGSVGAGGTDDSIPASTFVVDHRDRAAMTARQLAQVLRNATLLEEVLAQYKQESQDNRLDGVRELYLTGGSDGRPDSSSIELINPPLRKNTEGLYDVFGLEFKSAASGNALPGLLLAGTACFVTIFLLRSQ